MPINPKVEIATSDDGMTLEKRLLPNSAMGGEFREKFDTFKRNVFARKVIGAQPEVSGHFRNCGAQQMLHCA